ncbi:hypothetical protein [Demequina sp. NBRC 110056]|uniref:hypothetical protein n=1 Tax=Demequina sp. NBRC 110056 TaxID=1570345 RepID=UPI00117E43E6|nr:hypothetical protein [Demequina sp. NBRC 110056]
MTTWTVHATREPADTFLTAMDRRWRDGLASPSTACAWGQCRLHALVLLHLDRAVHKRRLRTRYFAAGACDADSHGFTPMSDLIPGDMYGPECLEVTHTGDASPLAAAIAAAKDDRHLLATAVITEAQFVAIDTFDDHSGALLRPGSHGAVVPFVYAASEETEDDAWEREDLLRANGYSTYTVDASAMGDDPVAVHRNLAALMEDVLDEIAHLKADAEAHVAPHGALWPLIVVRAPDTWDPTPRGAADAPGVDAATTEPSGSSHG